MTPFDNSIRVPLSPRGALLPRVARRGEPVTFGLPLPCGAVESAAQLRLTADDGTVRPLQVRALDHWPDGSVRWALLDFTIDVIDGVVRPLVVSAGTDRLATGVPSPIRVTQQPSETVRIDTGAAVFTFRKGQSFPFSEVSLADGTVALDAASSGFRLGRAGVRLSAHISHVVIREPGPLRVEAEVGGVLQTDAALPIHLSARVECFAGTATARVTILIRNTRRARHPGGEWVLGDPGSVLLDSASLVLALPHTPSRVHARIEADGVLEPMDLPLEIYQDSSGGPAWNSRTHLNRHGVVPVAFRGYRVRAGSADFQGLRATPLVICEGRQQTCAVALPEFWQHCPRAVVVDGATIDIGLLPSQFDDQHELQGGEQTTHTVVIAFAPDPVSAPALEWSHDPVRVFPSPEWCCQTGALPCLSPAAADDARYQELVATAFDGERGFLAKRERFDEYGWRHFGDVPGDHESAFQPSDQPFVSHYNNQYDAVAAFATHFLRSGDWRWWRLMDELARHVRDIDVYHTTEDKAAYNNGLFWHTQHYMDAGLSTHRTYPKGSGGGGPSAEHNYARGLILHYFLTGQEASREAAIGLGRWVIDMDDGRLTPLRWLASGPTGLVSATGTSTYHGPGRTPGNSIIACLVAHRLTGERRFLAKAEELIRRCIHPSDDIGARNLLDVERRWFYTVFLEALGEYLVEKAERDENDEMYAYAQQSLLRYAEWMATHEVPYLSRPEVLEYPTETWAAQDLRKASVFWWAAGHASDLYRQRFVERAEFFFADALSRLAGSSTRHFTRPVVVALRSGVYASWFRPALLQGRLWPEARETTFRPPVLFQSQRQLALQRARIVVGGVAVSALVLLMLAFFR